MKGTIIKSGENLIINLPYSDEGVKLIKTIPGRRFSPGKKVWKVPLSPASAERLQEIAGEFDCSPVVLKAIDEVLQTGNKLGALSRVAGIDNHIGDTRLARALRPFQRAGVLFAMEVKRCLIADEMGLGKTLQGLATAQLTDAFPLVVVCPASLKLNWEREAKKWLDGKTVRVLSGRSGHLLDGADVIIVNYDILGYGKNYKTQTKKGVPKIEWKSELVEALLAYGVRMAIIDESHYVKNWKANRTKACAMLCKKMNRIVLLSGTPVLSRPSELIAQLRIMGVFNSVFGTWQSFVERYCGAIKGPFGVDISGATNLPELNTKLRATCMVRRKKSEVLKELPAKTISHVITELAAKDRREYEKAREDVVSFLRDYDPVRADAAEQAQVLVQIEILKQLAVQGKLSFVKDWVRDFLESGEKLVLFGTHIAPIKEIVREFGSKAVMIIGDTKMEDRQKAVDLFQDPRSPVRLIVLNMKAGGVGLTLTAASNVAFFELGWTPGDHEQAEDRVHRIGQLDAVTAYYILAQGTIDESIMELLMEKRQVVQSATDGRKRPKVKRSIMGDLVRGLMK